MPYKIFETSAYNLLNESSESLLDNYAPELMKEEHQYHKEVYEKRKSLASKDRHFKLTWWLDPATRLKECASLPWLRPVELWDRTKFCESCRYLDLDYIVPKDTSNNPREVTLRGQTYQIKFWELRINTLRYLCRTNRSDCTLCELIYSTFAKKPDRFAAGLRIFQNTPGGSFKNDQIWYSLSFTTGEALRDQDRGPYTYGPLTFNLVCTPDDRTIGDRSTTYMWPEIDLLVVAGSEGTDTIKGSTVLLPDAKKGIDMSIICKWITTCKDLHIGHDGIQCPAVTPHYLTAEATYFIDVFDLHLVKRSPGETDYATLSYARGARRGYTHCRSNTSALLKTGSLRSEWSEIHVTVTDAIDVCCELGIPYLWCDTLCIVQDDEDELRQIDQIDLLHHSARLTIVGAALSFKQGLPGLTANSRTAPASTVTSAEGLQFTSVPHFSFSSIESSGWAKRGWCYSESRMAHNFLVFAPDQVYYFCRHGVSAERSISCAHEYPENALCSSLNSHRAPVHSIFAQPGDDWNVYAEAVTEFNKRWVGPGNDIIHAFTGIIRIMARRFRNGTFLNGLPLSLIGHALLWTANNPIDLRYDCPEIPSWTWAGWRGAARYHLTQPDIALIPCFSPVLADEVLQKTVSAADPLTLWTEWRDWKGHEEIVCPAGQLHAGPGICEHDQAFRHIMSPELHIISDVASMTWQLQGERQINIVNNAGKFAGRGKFDNKRTALRMQASQGISSRSSVRAKVRFIRIAYLDGGQAIDDRTGKWVGAPGKPAVSWKDRGADFATGPPHKWHSCWGLYAVLLVDRNGTRLGTGEVVVTEFNAVSKRNVHVVLR